MTFIETKNRKFGKDFPAYFIADIAANHDGNLERAKRLIELAAEAGADAAKFQHFSAETIVSEKGFRELGSSLAHQSSWKKTVVQVYEEASIPWDWTPHLAEVATRCGIDFFTAPYSLSAIDHIDPYVELYKVGSGDITWLESLNYIGSKGKPVLLATGASSMDDVERALMTLKKFNVPIVLMQCNTNYSGDPANVQFANISVLKNYAKLFPNVILGLSDHTPNNLTVLASIALGAKAIEKHFTDDRNRPGPDHYFSLDPITWKAMINEARTLESALGNGKKKIEENEKESIIVQRRSLRYASDLAAGHMLKINDLVALRPAPQGSLQPFEIEKLIGNKLKADVNFHDVASISDIST